MRLLVELGLLAAGDFVVVTNNASDFRRLYATQPLHAGLVIITPQRSGLLVDA